MGLLGLANSGGPSAICTSVCTPLDEAELQAAIDRLTRALATVDGNAIAELVAERRALREELSALQRDGAKSHQLGRACSTSCRARAEAVDTMQPRITMRASVVRAKLDLQVDVGFSETVTLAVWADVAQACSIDVQATPQVQPFLDQLLGQKAAAMHAGFAWHPLLADGR
jgi:hypothetical protein